MPGKSRVQLLDEEDDIPPLVARESPRIPYPVGMGRKVTDYCLLGCTNEELAELIGVSLSTVESWLVADPHFRRAVLKGRKEADSRVARSLYHRAIGMSVPETKAFNIAGKVQTVEIKRHYPPSENAMALWLANRQPGKWKSKEANGSASVDLAKLVEESLKRVNQARASQPGDDAEPVQATVLQQDKGS